MNIGMAKRHWKHWNPRYTGKNLVSYGDAVHETESVFVKTHRRCSCQCCLWQSYSSRCRDSNTRCLVVGVVTVVAVVAQSEFNFALVRGPTYPLSCLMPYSCLKLYNGGCDIFIKGTICRGRINTLCGKNILQARDVCTARPYSQISIERIARR